MDRNKHGYATCVDNTDIRMFGIFWKFARIGERLSPYVSICCIFMAVSPGRGSSLMDRLRCYGHDNEGR